MNILKYLGSFLFDLDYPTLEPEKSDNRLLSNDEKICYEKIANFLLKSCQMHADSQENLKNTKSLTPLPARQFCLVFKQFENFKNWNFVINLLKTLEKKLNPQDKEFSSLTKILNCFNAFQSFQLKLHQAFDDRFELLKKIERIKEHQDQIYISPEEKDLIKKQLSDLDQLILSIQTSLSQICPLVSNLTYEPFLSAKDDCNTQLLSEFLPEFLQEFKFWVDEWRKASHMQSLFVDIIENSNQRLKKSNYFINSSFLIEEKSQGNQFNYYLKYSEPSLFNKDVSFDQSNSKAIWSSPGRQPTLSLSIPSHLSLLMSNNDDSVLPIELLKQDQSMTYSQHYLIKNLVDLALHKVNNQLPN